MKKKIIIIFLICITLIISLASVAAADSELNSPHAIHNLTELQKDIDCSNNTITLQHNYSYQIGDSRVEITRNDFILNGNGYFIDGKNATGLFQINGTNITIINLNFINGNASVNGGAIDFTEGSLSLINCNFTSNIAQKAGGGVLVLGDVFISNCTFISNKAINGAGGGVRGGNKTQVILHNSYFEDNEANVCGGAACGSYGNIIVDNCTFIKNKCLQYGGAICIASTGTISNSVFIENKAILGGGAINRATDSSIIIKNCNMTNNSAPLGGAIRIGANNISIIENCILIGNHATLGGGINTGKNSLNLISNMYYDSNIAENGTIIFNSGLLFTVNSKVKTFSGIPIFNEGILLSNTIITVLNNETVYVSSNKTMLTAEIVCDSLKVNGGTLIFIVGENSMLASWNGTCFVCEYKIDFKDNIKVNADYLNSVNKTLNSATLKIKSTQLIGNDLEKFYKGKETYNVLLTKDNMPLVGKTIAITINGITYYKITDNNGIAKLNINLNPGVYTITAKYEEIVIENTITVKATIYSCDVMKMYKNDTQYHVLILDNNGNPISGESVAITVNGKTYYKLTDNNGIATLNINLNPGTYDISSSYNGISIFNKITVKSLIEGINLVKTYGTPDQYYCKVFDKTGIGATNKTVLMTINGKTYYKVTNQEGIAYLNINLLPGKYMIQSSYDGLTETNIITVRSN